MAILLSTKSCWLYLSIAWVLESLCAIYHPNVWAWLGDMHKKIDFNTLRQEHKIFKHIYLTKNILSILSQLVSSTVVWIQQTGQI